MRKNTPSKKSPYQLEQERKRTMGISSYDPMLYIKPQISDNTKVQITNKPVPKVGTPVKTAEEKSDARLKAMFAEENKKRSDLNPAIDPQTGDYKSMSAGEADWVWSAPLAGSAGLKAAGAIGSMALPGLSAVPGATVGNLVNSGFIANSLYNTPKNAEEWYDVSKGNKDWTDAALGTAEIAAGLIGSGAGAKTAVQELEKLGLKNVITGKAPIKDLFKRDDLINIKTPEDLARFKAAEAEGRLGETTNRFYSSSKNPDTLKYAKGEEEVFVHTVPQTKAAAAGKSLTNVKPKGAALIAKQRSIPTSATVEEMIASGKLSGQSEETLQGLREIAANPEGYWNLNSFKNNKELQSLVESPNLVNPAEHFLPRPSTEDFKLMSVGALGATRPKLINTQKITDKALAGLQEEGIGTHAIKHEATAEMENEYKLGGNMNFKSKGAYQNWLGYVHATGVAENTPGNQPVSIKGKTHNVQHATGGNMYANGGSFNNTGFMSLPKEVQQKIRSKSFAEGGPIEDTWQGFSKPSAAFPSMYVGATPLAPIDLKNEAKHHGLELRNPNAEPFMDNLRETRGFESPEYQEYKNAYYADKMNPRNKAFRLGEEDRLNNYEYGTTFENGGEMAQLTEFNAGGVHEENPLGGIPQGVNPNGQSNLVEEGETKLDSKNYIYSDSLKIDDETAIALQLSKSDIGKTFADISKKMNRSNSRRENDSIEEETKTRDLEALMEAQEVFKQKEIQRKKEEILALDPTAFDQQQPLAQMEQSQGMPPEMGQGQTMGDPMQGQPQIDPAMMQQMNMRLGGNMYNRYDFGGSLGAGAAGVASGIAGSLLPGPLGTMATKGIDTLHGQLDKNITDEERSIAGFGKAAGAIGTGIATGGASLSTGFNNITSGLGQGISNIEGVDPKAAKLINGVAGVAGMVGGEMTDGASSAEGMAGLSKLIPNSEDVAGMQGMIPFNYGGYLYSTGGVLGDPPVKKSTTPTFASQFVNLTPAEEARLRAEKVNQGLTDWNDPNNIVQMSTGDYPQWLKGKSHGASIMPKTAPVTPTLTLPKPPTVGYYTDPNTGQKVAIPNTDTNTGLQLQTNRQMSQGLEGIINTPEAMMQRQTEQDLRKQQIETNKGLINTMSPEDLQRAKERNESPQKYQEYQFQSAPIKGQPFPTLESPQFNLGGYMKKQNIYANGGPLTQEEYLQQLAMQQQNPFSANYPSMSMDNQALDGNMVMQNPNLEYIEEDQFEPQNEEEAFAQEQAKYEAEKQREAEYESNLQKSGPTGTDQNQNINIKQSPLEYVPLATNLAMGLFSKPQQLEYNDYLSKGKLTAPEMNINPQLRQADQTFAQGQSAVRNAAPGSGAYLSNMQQMANSRNAAYGQLYGQKENIDAQNKMTADQFNIQKEQQDSSNKFAIDDYNAKAKANKFQYLIDAGNQMGQLGSRDAQNQMGLAYGQLLAPDYKGTVSYTPWNPLNKTKV